MKYLKILCVLVLTVIILVACKKECVHEYQTAITKEASCTQAGVETHTCILCEEFFTTDIPATGHAFQEGVEEKGSSCAEPGILVYACANCNETKSEDIPVLEHVYGEGVILQEATCGEAGELAYHCENCDDVKHEQLPTLAHTPGEPTTTKEPNCTYEGEISTICILCGHAEVVEHIPTNGQHSMKEHVLQASTCLEKGHGEMKCIHCGYAEPVFYGLSDHRYGDFQVIREATCSEKGAQVRTCTVCGVTEERTIDKLAHTWDKQACNTPATCTVCGYYNSSGVSHQFKHDITIEPTKTFAGRRIEKCANCDTTRESYFGKSGDYNLGSVSSYAHSYASDLGFQVVSSGKGDPEYKRTADYRTVDTSGGMSYLKSMARDLIDRAYAYCEETPAGAEAYTIYVYTYYTQSGAAGSGYFGVYVYLG